ncbi:xeroderma pigmentosum group C-complementing protein, partial [Lecanoromycetidae sp. Uapishka_2]
MPPFIPHNRRPSTPPPDSPTPLKRFSAKKPSLFDAVDKHGTTSSLQDNKAFLEQLDDSESGSELSDVSSDEFEDVEIAPSPKRRKMNQHEAEDEEVDWEDAILPGAAPASTATAGPSGDLELTFGKDAQIGSFTNPHDHKKGPTKIERQIRMGVKKEIEKWKIASGIKPSEETNKTTTNKGKVGRKAAQSERNQRDWGRPAEKQEKGTPDMSRGDPILRLLKVLAAYWRKRFTITAPGLRKEGYKPLAILEEELASFKNDKHHPEEHGERVSSVEEFRKVARTCEGSRDLGAQLFTALIRGLGIEARLVASLQPLGFGWNKNEETSAKRRKQPGTHKSQDIESSDTDDVTTLTQKTSKTSGKLDGRSKRPVSKGAKEAPIDLSAESENLNIEDSDSGDDDASVIDVTPSTPRRRPNMNYDRDMSCPTYWTEVISPISSEVYPVDSLVLTSAVATNSDQLSLFEPRGTKADKAKQVFAYVVAYSSDGTAKEVTTRYLKRHIWPGRTKGMRMPVEKVPVHNKRGKIKYYEDYDWFKTVMSAYSKTHKMRTIVDDLEEAKDLKPVKPEKKEAKANEETLQGYKNSADFVLERHLRREEALRPGSKPVKIFASGKGDKAKEESVYRRKDVEVCRTGESWHKEGRAIKVNELPMKMVPVRAVTLTRKREVEEAERDTGEKLKQGLYAWDQTDWIIPPPIENGVIPKNAFGNMDCYVPTMVPKGAVHIPLRKTMGICKRLGVDYAEAVTGFEFGNKRAVPIITGVVVAEENKNTVLEAWEKEEDERRIKEEGKREKAALATWRKWLMGLRIVQRVREEYGEEADAHMKEAMNPFTNQNKIIKAARVSDAQDIELDEDANSHHDGNPIDGFVEEDDFRGGGFLPEGYGEEELPNQKDELVIEDDKQPGTCEAASTLHTSARAIASMDQLSNVESDTQSTKKTRKSKPVVSGAHSRKSERKSSEAKTPKNEHVKGKRRKVSSSLAESDLEDHVGPMDRMLQKKSNRATPKRKAATKSATALKSPYFEPSSDEDEISSDSKEATGIINEAGLNRPSAPHVPILSKPPLAYLAMNIERPKSSTASVSSSTTLRPRNRRQTQEDDDEAPPIPKASNWLDGPAVSSSSSRAPSPNLSSHPSKPTRANGEWERSRSSSRFLGLPGVLGSQVSSTNLATGLLGSSWSSLSNFTSTLMGSNSSRVSSPDGRRRGYNDATHRNTSAPPAQWGPPGAGDKGLGAGTPEDRRAKLQAEKRKALLAANGRMIPDSLGRYKRRDSDERNHASVPPGQEEDRDALVYIHKVKPEDTLAGVTIKYNCQANAFRKANRLWPNDTIQIRQTVVLPVDACGVRGRKIAEPDSPSAFQNAGNTGEIMPTPTVIQAPWADLHDTPSDKETPLSSIPTSPSISVTFSNPEEPPWKHDSWVMIDGFPDAVEIARLSRKTLGYFPRSRRKSASFSDLETPSESLDLPRGNYQSSPPRQKTKSRSSSGSYFAHQLQGPGGVGTMGKNVHSPGPAQDGLNKLFATHLPNVAPRSSLESLHSSSSHGNGIENIGGAVEGWVRKLATKAANKVQPSTPGGSSGVGDLIELSEDAFEIGDDGDDEDDTRRNTITSANVGLGVGAWSSEQERMLQERFPPRGRVVGESSRRGKSIE